ncbi:MAG: hypothetical protein K2O66_03045 [Bacteroidales bacterium]|nr:hypothetical protein [Bacteroidales bacterium]
MKTNKFHNEGYLLRAQRIQEIDRMYYQPYQASCHKKVWQQHVYPVFGCSYRAFLRYLKTDTSSLADNGATASLKK